MPSSSATSPFGASLVGIPRAEWARLARRHRGEAGPARSGWIRACSLPASAVGRLEDALYGRRLAESELELAPIFVLGLRGSGADALRDLLIRDPALTAPTRWQVGAPTAPIAAERLGRWLPGARAAAEDELALAKLTGLSPYLAEAWPDRAADYERYLDFFEAPHAERARWKCALTHLVKKLSLATGRRAVLASGPHAARIRLLTECFPDARFVHVHRHPYDLFSALRAAGAERVLSVGERVYERLIDDRRFVPAGRLAEIGWEELCARPLETLADLYARLDLPDGERAQRAMTSCVPGSSRPAPLDAAERELVWSRWRLLFDTYGYQRERV